MSCSARPAFWRRQDRLPLKINRFLQIRLQAALQDPSKRTLLVWPAILGAPFLREAHPQGIPESQLRVLAARMVQDVGGQEPLTAWAQDREAFPDSAAQGPFGWKPHGLWVPFAARVSLRSGVSLLALTGQPEDDRYLLACGVALFNSSLFHECHDALELLWRRSEGDLKNGLQGLILLASGYYHQQHHHAAGMRSIWKDGLAHLRPFKGTLETPWGRIAFTESLAMVSQRLEWLQHMSPDEDWTQFWETSSPGWEFA